jgi:hypothetical protein
VTDRAVSGYRVACGTGHPDAAAAGFDGFAADQGARGAPTAGGWTFVQVVVIEQTHRMAESVSDMYGMRPFLFTG